MLGDCYASLYIYICGSRTRIGVYYRPSQLPQIGNAWNDRSKIGAPYKRFEAALLVLTISPKRVEARRTAVEFFFSLTCSVGIGFRRWTRLVFEISTILLAVHCAKLQGNTSEVCFRGSGILTEAHL